MEEDEDEVYPTHLWCINAPAEVANLLRKYCQYDQPSWLNPAEEYLCSCQDCLELYHEGKRILVEDKPNFKEPLEVKEILRLRNWINAYLEVSEKDDVPESQLAQFLEHYSPEQLQQPIQEILQYPHLLFSKELNDDFVKFVAFQNCSGTQVGGDPNIPVRQMPGIFLLLIHPNQMVREWSSRILHRMQPITRDNYDEVSQIIGWMMSPLEFGMFDNLDEETWDTMSSLSRHLVCLQDQEAYWKGVMQLLRCLDEGAIKARLMGPSEHRCIANAVINVIIESNQTDSCEDSWQPDVFWPALDCLEALLCKLGCSLWQYISKGPDMILKAITSHPVFEKAISGEQQADSASSLQSSSTHISSHITASSFPLSVVNANEPFVWLKTFVDSFLDVGDLANKYIKVVIIFLVYRAECGLDPDNTYFDNDGCVAKDAFQKKTRAAHMVEKVMKTFLDIVDNLLELEMYQFLISSVHRWPHTFVLYLQQDHSTSQHMTKQRCRKIVGKLLRGGLKLDHKNKDYKEFIRRIDGHRPSISGNHSEKRLSVEVHSMEEMHQEDIDRFVGAIEHVVKALQDKKDLNDFRSVELVQMPQSKRQRTESARKRKRHQNKHDKEVKRHESLSSIHKKTSTLTKDKSTHKTDRPSSGYNYKVYSPQKDSMDICLKDLNLSEGTKAGEPVENQNCIQVEVPMETNVTDSSDNTGSMDDVILLSDVDSFLTLNTVTPIKQENVSDNEMVVQPDSYADAASESSHEMPVAILPCAQSADSSPNVLATRLLTSGNHDVITVNSKDSSVLIIPDDCDTESLNDLISHQSLHSELGKTTDVDKDCRKDGSKDVKKDVDKDGSKDVSNDVDKDSRKDVNKDVGKDVDKDGSKDVGIDVDRDGSKDVDKDCRKDVNKDVGKDVCQDGNTDVSKDGNKDDIKDNISDGNKNSSKWIVPDVHGTTSPDLFMSTQSFELCSELNTLDDDKDDGATQPFELHSELNASGDDEDYSATNKAESPDNVMSTQPFELHSELNASVDDRDYSATNRAESPDNVMSTQPFELHSELNASVDDGDYSATNRAESPDNVMSTQPFVASPHYQESDTEEDEYSPPMQHEGISRLEAEGNYVTVSGEGDIHQPFVLVQKILFGEDAREGDYIDLMEWPAFQKYVTPKFTKQDQHKMETNYEPEFEEDFQDLSLSPQVPLSSEVLPPSHQVPLSSEGLPQSPQLFVSPQVPPSQEASYSAQLADGGSPIQRSHKKRRKGILDSSESDSDYGSIMGKQNVSRTNVVKCDTISITNNSNENNTAEDESNVIKTHVNSSENDKDDMISKRERREKSLDQHRVKNFYLQNKEVCHDRANLSPTVNEVRGSFSQQEMLDIERELAELHQDCKKSRSVGKEVNQFDAALQACELDARGYDSSRKDTNISHSQEDSSSDSESILSPPYSQRKKKRRIVKVKRDFFFSINKKEPVNAESNSELSDSILSEKYSKSSIASSSDEEGNVSCNKRLLQKPIRFSKESIAKLKQKLTLKKTRKRNTVSDNVLISRSSDSDSIDENHQLFNEQPNSPTEVKPKAHKTVRSMTRNTVQTDTIPSSSKDESKSSTGDDFFDPFAEVPSVETGNTNETSPLFFDLNVDDDDAIAQNSCELIDEDVYSQLAPEMIIISSEEEDDFAEIKHEVWEIEDDSYITAEEDIKVKDIDTEFVKCEEIKSEQIVQMEEQLNQTVAKASIVERNTGQRHDLVPDIMKSEQNIDVDSSPEQNLGQAEELIPSVIKSEQNIDVDKQPKQIVAETSSSDKNFVQREELVPSIIKSEQDIEEKKHLQLGGKEALGPEQNIGHTDDSVEMIVDQNLTIYSDDDEMMIDDKRDAQGAIDMNNHVTEVVKGMELVTSIKKSEQYLKVEEQPLQAVSDTSSLQQNLDCTVTEVVESKEPVLGTIRSEQNIEVSGEEQQEEAVFEPSGLEQKLDRTVTEVVKSKESVQGVIESVQNIEVSGKEQPEKAVVATSDSEQNFDHIVTEVVKSKESVQGVIESEQNIEVSGKEQHKTSGLETNLDRTVTEVVQFKESVPGVIESRQNVKVSGTEQPTEGVVETNCLKQNLDHTVAEVVESKESVTNAIKSEQNIKVIRKIQSEEALADTSRPEQIRSCTVDTIPMDTKPNESIYSDISSSDGEFNSVPEPKKEMVVDLVKSKPHENVKIKENFVLQTFSLNQTYDAPQSDVIKEVDPCHNKHGSDAEYLLHQEKANDDIVTSNVIVPEESHVWVRDQDDGEEVMDINMIGEADDDNVFIDYDVARSPSPDHKVGQENAGKQLPASSFYRNPQQGEMSKSDQLAGEMYLEVVSDKVASLSSMTRSAMWSPPPKPKAPNQNSGACSSSNSSVAPVINQTELPQNEKPRARAPVKSCANRFTSRQGALFDTMKSITNKDVGHRQGSVQAINQRTSSDGGQPLSEVNKDSVRTLEESAHLLGNQHVAKSSKFSSSSKVAEGILPSGKENIASDINRSEPMIALSVIPKAVSFPAAEVIPKKQPTKMNFLEWVLSWDCDMLMQKKDYCYISGILRWCEYNSAIPVPTDFSSIDRYYQVFLPHILIETWAKLRNEYEESVKPVIECVMYKTMARDVRPSGFCLMTCQVQVPIPRDKESDSNYSLSDEDLVVVSPHPDTNPMWSQMFAIVLQVSTRQNPRTASLEEVLPEDIEPRKLMDVVLLTLIRDDNFSVFQGQQFSVKVMGSLKSATRQFQGVTSLRKSVLARDILRYRRMDVFCQDNIRRESVEYALQSTSTEVTDAAVKAISEPDMLPRIFLLQGPPGTGKTSTITNIILQLLKRQEARSKQSNSSSRRANTPQPKILLCAPSNAAVNVLVLRLKTVLTDQERTAPPGTGIKLPHHNAGNFSIVRLGSRDVHLKVKDFSLEYLVEKRIRENEMAMRRKETEANTEVVAKLKELDQKINALEMDINRLQLADHNDAVQLTHMKIDRDELCSQRRLLERNKRQSRGPRLSVNASRIRQSILMKADVICCTLNSSGGQMFQSIIYAPNNSKQRKQVIQFSCVIVDEATQCTEPDCLIPLQYGASKLLLVGDPKQLPATVISRESTKMKYNQSLFGRYYRYFKLNVELIPNNPIRMLKTQYRMHSEICRFPSMHFYGGLLETDRGNALADGAEPRDTFFLWPYRVFDVVDGKEHCYAPGFIINEEEMKLIKELYNCITEGFDKRSCPGKIGIITPYQTQKRYLLKEFHGKSNVEVATVDSFQGREKDVIILSCVRTNGQTQGIGFVADPNRMNVALTRARYALYVVGNLASLFTDHNWKALINDAAKRRLILQAKKGTYASVVSKCKKRRPSSDKSGNSSLLRNASPRQTVGQRNIVSPRESAQTGPRSPVNQGHSDNTSDGRVSRTKNDSKADGSSGSECVGFKGSSRINDKENGKLLSNPHARICEVGKSVSKSNSEQTNNSGCGQQSRTHSNSKGDRLEDSVHRYSDARKKKTALKSKKVKGVSEQTSKVTERTKSIKKSSNISNTSKHRVQRTASVEERRRSSGGSAKGQSKHGADKHRRLSASGDNLIPRHTGSSSGHKSKNKQETNIRSSASVSTCKSLLPAVAKHTGNQTGASATAEKALISSSPVMTSTPEKKDGPVSRQSLVVSPDVCRKLTKGIQRFSHESQSDSVIEGQKKMRDNVRHMYSANVLSEQRLPDLDRTKSSSGITEGSTATSAVGGSNIAEETVRKSLQHLLIPSAKQDMTSDQRNYEVNARYESGAELQTTSGDMSPSRNRARRGRAWKADSGSRRQDSYKNNPSMETLRLYQHEPTQSYRTKKSVTNFNDRSQQSHHSIERRHSTNETYKHQQNPVEASIESSNRGTVYPGHHKSVYSDNQSSRRHSASVGPCPGQPKPVPSSNNLQDIIQKVKSKNANQSRVKIVEPNPKRRCRRSSGMLASMPPVQGANDDNGGLDDDLDYVEAPSSVQGPSLPVPSGKTGDKPVHAAKPNSGHKGRQSKPGPIQEAVTQEPVQHATLKRSLSNQKKTVEPPNVPNARKRIAHIRKEPGVQLAGQNACLPLQEKGRGNQANLQAESSFSRNMEQSLLPDLKSGQPSTSCFTSSYLNQAGQASTNRSSQPYLNQARQDSINHPAHPYLNQAGQANTNHPAHPYINQAGQASTYHPVHPYINQAGQASTYHPVHPYLNQAGQANTNHPNWNQTGQARINSPSDVPSTSRQDPQNNRLDSSANRGQQRLPGKSCLKRPGQKPRGVKLRFHRDTRDNSEASRNKSKVYQSRRPSNR